MVRSGVATIFRLSVSTLGITRTGFGKILRPKPTVRKGVLAILIVLAIIAMANKSDVVRLSEFEVKDRSIAPLESAIGLAPESTEDYATALQNHLLELQGPVTAAVRAAISDDQSQRSRAILGVLVGLTFTGLIFVFAPLPLARRYPKRKSILNRFSWLSAVMFILVGNVFVGIYALTRFSQSLVSTASNPQLSLTESTFSFLIDNSDELAAVGPGIIEPAMRSIENDPSAPALDTILANVYTFMGEVEVYQSMASVAKITVGLFSIIPLFVLLVAFALVLRNAMPTMKTITRLPGDAARGVERAGRKTIGETSRSIGRELIYALGMIGVLLVVTIVIAATGTNAVEPALQVVLNYILASIVYIQLTEEARPGLVFFSVAATLAYLTLMMAMTVGIAGIFLFKASRLLRHSSREGFRSIQQRRFWLIGFGGLLWMMLFPMLYAQTAGSVVSGLVQVGVDYSAWGFIFISPPVVMLLMFFVSLWAVNGYRTISFIWRYSPEAAVPEAPDEPEPITFPDAESGALLEDVRIQIINDPPEPETSEGEK